MVGPGWSVTYNRIGVGDSDADGAADILATVTDGTSHYWHNSGRGTLTKLANAGTGWQTLEWIAVVDVNGDNRSDLVAVRTSDNTLWRWSGDGTLGTAAPVGQGWSGFRPASY